MEAKQIWVMAFVLTGSAWAVSELTIRLETVSQKSISLKGGYTLGRCDFYFRDPHRWPNVWL